jgi:hypothetical protein
MGWIQFNGKSVHFARLHHHESLLLRRQKMSCEQGVPTPCQGSAIDALRSIARVTKAVESFAATNQSTTTCPPIWVNIRFSV